MFRTMNQQRFGAQAGSSEHWRKQHHDPSPTQHRHAHALLWTRKACRRQASTRHMSSPACLPDPLPPKSPSTQPHTTRNRSSSA